MELEGPLEGTLFVMTNQDQPGVIGEVGTILGRHRINIADFALGRGRGSAVGVVKVDVPAADDRSLSAALEELRAVKAIQSVRLVKL